MHFQRAIIFDLTGIGRGSRLFCNRSDDAKHRKRMRVFSSTFLRPAIFALISVVIFSPGCNLVKSDRKTARLLKTETTTQTELIKEVNRFARVNSLRAKIDLKFEDNSFAVFGLKEVYRQAPGEIVVQRPNKILLKVHIPVVNTDIVQMTSDGETFRVAILQDGGDGKNKKFVKGTNSADYSKLQKKLNASELEHSKKAKESVNAFANLRPQHFTDAMLVRPTSESDVYIESTIFQTEEDQSVDNKSQVRSVMRGYYLLDEFAKQDDGTLKITRRFWFDRVGGIRLARQQIFDAAGEIESDIVYGKEGNLTDTGNYANLPLQITVTRPKENYAMTLIYQTPETVMIGNKFPDAAFVLQNSWNLEEVDLDQKLREISAEQKSTDSNKAITKFH